MFKNYNVFENPYIIIIHHQPEAWMCQVSEIHRRRSTTIRASTWPGSVVSFPWRLSCLEATTTPHDGSRITDQSTRSCIINTALPVNTALPAVLKNKMHYEPRGDLTRLSVRSHITASHVYHDAYLVWKHPRRRMATPKDGGVISD